MAPLTDVQTLTGLQEQIAWLTTAVQALQQEDYINVQPQENEEEDIENPIIITEQGIPEFNGEQSAPELLNWIVTVEETLEFKRVPLERCVPMVAMRFRGRAAAWWSQLKTSRARLGKPKILSWDKLKKKMRKTFLPFNYDQQMLHSLHTLQQGNGSVCEYYDKFFAILTRVDLQDSDQELVAHFVGGLRREIRVHLNLLNPLTLAQARQQALTVETQIHDKSKFWVDVAKDFALAYTFFLVVFSMGDFTLFPKTLAFYFLLGRLKP